MLIVKLFSRIPWPVLIIISDLLYLLVYKVFRYRVAVVTRNLAASFPDKSKSELKSIKNRFYRGFFDFVMESLKSITMTRKDFEKRVVFNNLDFFNDLPKDRPVVILGSHFFNWEWIGMVASAFMNRKMYYSYQKLSSAFSDRVMNETRSKFGAEGVLRHETARKVISLRKDKQSILVIADQSPVGKSKRYWTRFLNQDTAFYHGIGDMSKLADAMVVIMLPRKTGRGKYEIKYEWVAKDVSNLAGVEIVDRYIEILEREIKGNPSGWLWTHKRWKHKMREDDIVAGSIKGHGKT